MTPEISKIGNGQTIEKNNEINSCSRLDNGPIKMSTF